jgi:hypothetical protein
MSRLFSLIVVAVLVLALATGWIETDRPSTQRIDPRLKESVRVWRHDMDRTQLVWQARFFRIDPMVVEPLPNGNSGCYDHWSHRLSVSPEQLLAGPYSTRATVYHELGHGVFFLKHGSCKLMGPALDEAYLRQNWNQLVSEYIIAANNQSNLTP